MTTNITAVLVLIALGLAIETTIIKNENIDSSNTVCAISNPGGGQLPPPPQQ